MTDHNISDRKKGGRGPRSTKPTSKPSTKVAAGDKPPKKGGGG